MLIKAKTKKHTSGGLLDIIEDVQIAGNAAENAPSKKLKDEETEIDTDGDESAKNEDSDEKDSDEDKDVQEEDEKSSEDADEVKEDSDEESDDKGEDQSDVKEDEDASEVDPKQKLVDELMKKVATMDEEQLTSLHGQIVVQDAPDQVQKSIDSVKAGSTQVQKADAPKAKSSSAVSDLEEDKSEDEDSEKTKTEDASEDEDKDEVKEDSDEDDSEDKENVKEESDEESDDKEDSEKTKTEDKEKSEDEDEVAESMDDEDDVDVEDDVNALVKSESNLTQGFKDKAKTIVEAAIKAKIKIGKQKLTERFNVKLTKESAKIEKNLTEKVDSFLGYVIQEWLKENKVSVDSKLRTQISENFMLALKNTFKEHYIEVPAKNDKKGAVEIQADKELAIFKVNEQNLKVQVANQKRLIERYQRSAGLAKASKGLTSIQSNRLEKLSEGIKFVSPELFQKKLVTLRESYFPATSSAKVGAKPGDKKSSIVKSMPKAIVEGKEIIVEGEIAENEQLSLEMKSYMTAISRGHQANPNRKV